MRDLRGRVDRLVNRSGIEQERVTMTLFTLLGAARMDREPDKFSCYRSGQTSKPGESLEEFEVRLKEAAGDECLTIIAGYREGVDE